MKISKEDRCEVKKCKNAHAITFYGYRVCQKHYDKHCEGKINLKRKFNIKEDVKKKKKKIVLKRKGQQMLGDY
jgi:hypothetical protein